MPTFYFQDLICHLLWSLNDKTDKSKLALNFKILKMFEQIFQAEG